VGLFQGALAGRGVQASGTARHGAAATPGVRLHARAADRPGRALTGSQARVRGSCAGYEQAMDAHAQAERSRRELLARAQSAHEQSVARERERVRRQHALVDQMARDFAEGKRKAVADYFSGVLTVQRYPSDFPTGVKVAYLPPDRELRIDIDLPLTTAIPELESAEYLITKKEFRYKKLTAAARNKLYQQVVAQMALRNPTDFKSMTENDIKLITTRGEQLTRVLIEHYCPNIV
jgi:hypothetical protein